MAEPTVDKLPESQTVEPMILKPTDTSGTAEQGAGDDVLAEQKTEETTSSSQSASTEPKESQLGSSQSGSTEHKEPQSAGSSHPEQVLTASAAAGSSNQSQEFTTDKKLILLELTEEFLKWTLKTPAKKDTTSSSVPVKEILTAATVKISKSEQVTGFCIHYVKHLPNNLLKPAMVTFYGTSDLCHIWVNKIQERLKLLSNRPRKLLVLVNPGSGGKKGRQSYQSLVAPLFEQAGIEADVIVTEKYLQMKDEILPSYDLSSISGVVVVGGDGSYYEAINGLLLRAQKEASVNADDPTSEIKAVDLPIGVIPCGTGNGMAGCCYGCVDVVTAALAIIIGDKMKQSVGGYYQEGKLVAYFGILVCYGWLGDLIDATERNRSMGRMRYPYHLVKALVQNNQRELDLEIQYLPAEEPQALGEQGKAESAAEGAVGTDWQTVKGKFSMVNNFMFDFLATSKNRPITMPETSTTLFIAKRTNRKQLISFVYKMMTKSGVAEAINEDYVQVLRVKAWRLKHLSPSDPSTADGMRDLYLDVDGELCKLKTPEFETRLHVGAVTLFVSPEVQTKEFR